MSAMLLGTPIAEKVEYIEPSFKRLCMKFNPGSCALIIFTVSNLSDFQFKNEN
jgi:hypothetical protein